VNSLRVRLDHVLEWLRSAAPDVLALQEIKMPDDEFPALAFAELGYVATTSGQPGYNGVAILSRTAPTDVRRELARFPDTQKRVLGATFDGLRLWCLYVPNGQSVDSDKYAYKLQWLEALRAELADELGRHPALLAVGDFNIAPDDRDVYDPERWRGHVLCTPEERAALARICELGFEDVFRRFETGPGHFSWWDYRAGAFRRNQGLRIDLALASTALSKTVAGCRIDREPRGWDRPSDHVPLVTEVALS
jgi:exodeoxyribonuclease-3